MSAYKNSFEARCARDLGSSFAYEPIRLPYTIQAHYVPDFVDVANKRIVEGKGLFDAADRRKLLAVQRQHPEWSIEVWFTNPQKTISKASQTTYASWCDKNGIAWRQGPRK